MGCECGCACACVCSPVFLADFLVCKPLLSHVVDSGLPPTSLCLYFFFAFLLLRSFLSSLLSISVCAPPAPPLSRYFTSFSLLLFPFLSAPVPCTPTPAAPNSALLAKAHVTLGMSSETPGPHLTCKGQAGPRPSKAPVARRNWEQTDMRRSVGWRKTFWNPGSKKLTHC